MREREEYRSVPRAVCMEGALMEKEGRKNSDSGGNQNQ